MKNGRLWCRVAVLVGLASVALVAQQAAPAPQGTPAQPPAAGGRQGGAPPQPMLFFVTSVGKGDGGNLGGLTGADAHCQQSLRPQGPATRRGVRISARAPRATRRP